ncbi:MAG: SRPBCC family protein [Frankiaceae bacterium]
MVKTLSAKIFVKSDPATIMDVIAELERDPEWASGVQHIDVLETYANGRPKIARFFVSAGGVTDESLFDYAWEDDHCCLWYLTKGTTQRQHDGIYTLRPRDEGTEVAYDLVVRLRLPLPEPIRRVGQQKIMQAALRDLKSRVES